MGSSFSSFSSSDSFGGGSRVIENDLDYVTVKPKTTTKIPEKYSHIETRDDVIKEFGEPDTDSANGPQFFAVCVEEDMFLMGGARQTYSRRLTFSEGKSAKVVYLDSENKVMAIF